MRAPPLVILLLGVCTYASTVRAQQDKDGSSIEVAQGVSNVGIILARTHSCSHMVFLLYHARLCLSTFSRGTYALQ